MALARVCRVRTMGAAWHPGIILPSPQPPMIHPLPKILLSFALLLGPVPSFAATVAWYTQGMDAATAAAAVKWETGLTDFRVEGPVEALLDPAGVTVLGWPTRSCATDGRPKVGDVVVRAQAAIDEMEYGSVAAALADAARALPCGAEGASRDALYQLHFLHGLAAFNGGNVAEAKEAFTAAAVVDPARAWPSEYPPTAQPLFLEALQAALRTPAVVQTSFPAGLRIDGAFPAADAPLSLVPGPHIVELGPVVLAVDVLARAKDHGIVASADLLTGLAEGSALAARWFEEELARRAVVDALLVRPDGVFRLVSGAFAPASRRPTVSIRPGIVLAVSGGAVAAFGLALNLGSYEAAGLVEVGGQKAFQGLDADYQKLRAANAIGLGAAVAGGVAAVIGVGWSIHGEVSRHRRVSATASPWVIASGDGAALGFAGRW